MNMDRSVALEGAAGLLGRLPQHGACWRRMLRRPGVLDQLGAPAASDCHSHGRWQSLVVVRIDQNRSEQVLICGVKSEGIRPAEVDAFVVDGWFGSVPDTRVGGDVTCGTPGRSASRQLSATLDPGQCPHTVPVRQSGLPDQERRVHQLFPCEQPHLRLVLHQPVRGTW